VRVVALLGANALMLVAGLGLLPWLGVARSWRELAKRWGLSYLCGLAATGILAAHLALVHVSVGWVELSVFAVAAAGAGAWRLRGTEAPSWQRPAWITLAGLAVLAAVLVEYGRAFAVAPLNRYDAWAIWALKGHALYAFGWADPSVFAGAEYRFANLDYPLLLPAVEAVGEAVVDALDVVDADVDLPRQEQHDIDRGGDCQRAPAFASRDEEPEKGREHEQRSLVLRQECGCEAERRDGEWPAFVRDQPAPGRGDTDGKDECERDVRVGGEQLIEHGRRQGNRDQ
jgi:hypothetical protein